ncbi:transporter substrate-binding protein [Sedimentitalea sp. JM2-8]|uniref:Transporter substrate-binding protein n=1 Tax=Sedimentitalea xiamensis TaxID=3050037 RepID=A0ABT7FCF1_9RHOB|nr:ABC transporter substrate-binding protein [Sedimentitalea xiamensis]MDK3072793.1 transporter substrate-binding protein [Sedimentitalea xiamensis]
MKLSRRHFVVGSSALALTAPATIGRAQSDAIKFVSILDLSGGLDIYGAPMAETTKLAIEDINAAGGLLGREVELTLYDAQSTIQFYTQYATQAAAGDKADTVHAGITSASREAIRPTLARFKTLYFYNVQYEGGVCDYNNFCTGSTPAQTVAKVVPYAMEKWGKKVYIVAADYNYGQITAQWMQRFVAENGGETLDVEFFPLDVTNFGPTINKIQTAKPDFVISALVGGAHVSFYRQYAAAGMMQDIPIASTTFGVGNEQKLISAEEGNGILASYGYFEGIDNPVNKAFLERLEAKLGADRPVMNELAIRSYEGAMLWAEAVKAAGTVDREPVIEALRSGLTYEGPSGAVTIDPHTNHCSMNVYIGDLQDQTWNIVESFADQPPADTALVCDLVANPDQSAFLFENGLEAAGIK